MQFKPDIEKVLTRYEAWWQCQVLDRPLVSIRFPKPPERQVPWPEKTHATLRDRWLDTEYAVARAVAGITNTVYYADALPVAIPNLGPEIFSAFYGCPLEFGESTSWSSPILEDWSPESVARLQLDRENPYFRKILEITDALLAVGQGRFAVGYMDLHGGGDAIAAFRDPQQLCLDMIEHPDAVKALCRRITDDFLDVYDFYYKKLSSAGMPSVTWCPSASRGKMHVPSNDFSCMISKDMFEEVFLDELVRECRHMDRCIYHLDGPNALRYLDTLLAIPEIHAIQWVPGAGQDYWGDWVDVYRRIQEAGKAMQILEVPVADLARLTEVLRPEGVWISNVSGIGDMDAAAAALKTISAWR